MGRSNFLQVAGEWEGRRAQGQEWVRGSHAAIAAVQSNYKTMLISGVPPFQAAVKSKLLTSLSISLLHYYYLLFPSMSQW